LGLFLLGARADFAVGGRHRNHPAGPVGDAAVGRIERLAAAVDEPDGIHGTVPSAAARYTAPSSDDRDCERRRGTAGERLTQPLEDDGAVRSAKAE
jgi:hypothetical protein